MKKSIRRVHEALKELIDFEFEDTDWAPTPKKELGDFSIPCFKLAKKLSKAPPLVASELAPKLHELLKGEGFKDVKAVGPYLNIFRETRSLFEKLSDSIIQKPSEFGGLGYGKGKRAVIDFSSPNVAKEIGLHHLRSTAIGNSLSQILALQGYKVERINYLGDWGTSFGKLILGLQMFGDEGELKKQGLSYMLDLYVKFNQKEKEDADLSEKAKEAFQKLESGDSEYRRIWSLFRDISISQFKILYNRLGIDFDHYDGESLYETKLEKVVQEVTQKIGTRKSEGALVCDLEGHKIPVLLQKDDGASLYITRDLAAIQDRHERFEFDLALYVVAIQQQLHFKQLFDLSKALKKPYANKVEHISFGMLAFGSKTMKSREGNAIFLKSALDEGKERALKLIQEKNPTLPDMEKIADQIGMGALIFSDLSQNRNHNINFEWDNALSFEGDTAPFIQYTHARCSSLIEKTTAHLETLSKERSESSDAIYELDVFRGLVLSWDSFDMACEKAYLNRDPSQIAGATLDVARAFNQLYHKVRFLDVDNKAELQTLRTLTLASKKLLHHGLSLLGIQSPEKM